MCVQAHASKCECPMQQPHTRTFLPHINRQKQAGAHLDFLGMSFLLLLQSLGHFLLLLFPQLLAQLLHFLRAQVILRLTLKPLDLQFQSTRVILLAARISCCSSHASSPRGINAILLHFTMAQYFEKQTILYIYIYIYIYVYTHTQAHPLSGITTQEGSAVRGCNMIVMVADTAWQPPPYRASGHVYQHTSRTRAKTCTCTNMGGGGADLCEGLLQPDGCLPLASSHLLHLTFQDLSLRFEQSLLLHKCALPNQGVHHVHVNTHTHTHTDFTSLIFSNQDAHIASLL